MFEISVFIAILLLLLQIAKRINSMGKRAWIASIIYQLIILIYGVLSFATNSGSNWNTIIYIAFIFPASEIIFLFLLSVVP